MMARYPYEKPGTQLDEFRENLIKTQEDVAADINELAGGVSAAILAAKQVSGLVWLEPVASFSALASTYPNAKTSSAVMATDTGRIYRFDGKTWGYIQQIDAGPVNALATSLAKQSEKTDLLTQQFGKMALKEEVRKSTSLQPINVSEMDTETKKLFTGGSVSVVEENAVGSENIKPKAVGMEKTNFLSSIGLNVEKITGLAFNADMLINEFTVYAVTYKVDIPYNESIRITAENNDRFRIGILNNPNPYDYTDGVARPGVKLDKLIDLDGSKEYIYTNDDRGKELYLYVKMHGSGSAGVPVVTANFESNDIKAAEGRRILADGFSRKLTGEEIEEFSVSPKHLSFYDETTRPFTVLSGWLDNATPGKLTFTRTPNVQFQVYTIPLNPYEYVNITGKDMNKFRVGVSYSEAEPAPSGLLMDRVILDKDSAQSVDFYNDGKGVKLFVYVSSTGNNPSVNFSVYTSRLQGGKTEISTKYELEIGAIANSQKGIAATKDSYPVLFGVKTSNERLNKKPEVQGWLYYENSEPYRLLYAAGKPENLEHVATWKKEVTYQGDKTPLNYSPFVTKDGDIIFVFRGEQVDDETTRPTYNPEGRQNPIIYPAGDLDNPVVVDFGDRIKPTNWLMNCGADYIYNQDCLIFAEYTRTVHQKAYVWKVTKPFTDPNNWRIVKEFTLSGDYVAGMKHLHTINFDPYSEQVFMSTGDDSTAAAIWVSNDYGENWSLLVDGSEKHCRVLNFVFTKDKIYWATDSFKTDMHFLFSINRAADGKAILNSLADITELAKLPTGQATYILAHIENPFGLLILDRYDNPSALPMNVYFWSFKTESLHIVKVIQPLNGAVTNVGFRPEATNWYQALNDDRIVCGFGYRPNENDVLGNKTNDRVENLTLRMTEIIETE